MVRRRATWFERNNALRQAAFAFVLGVLFATQTPHEWRTAPGWGCVLIAAGDVAAFVLTWLYISIWRRARRVREVDDVHVVLPDRADAEPRQRARF